ncbi:hypothetical protein AB0O77_33390 [Streptomyces albidoflavus]|uniref:hypothetical protein n=1 Tax=Streptomyces albidoflavus TaxID=1886 RepID=UPI00344A097B
MTHNHQYRRATGGFFTGAVVCVALAAGTGSTGPVWVAAGLLAGSLAYLRRAMPRRPYAYWPAWIVGAALALLFAWAVPASRPALLVWASVEAVVALVLALLWYRRRTGAGDWIVWLPEENVLLRREWSRREAVRWADGYYFGKPCAVSPVDDVPHMADQPPLHPDHDRPWYQPPGPGEED